MNPTKKPVSGSVQLLGSALRADLKSEMRSIEARAPDLAAGESALTLVACERWYVVRTQVQRELRAAHQLRNQGFRVFVPRGWKNRRHARRLETISAPLFPRYIFTIVERSINGTLGVDRLLMCGGEPQPVPHGLVENPIATTDIDGNIHFEHHLREGQSVKAIAGPFANLIGTLEQLDEKWRVRILLELMGASPIVALHAQ
jgi:transcription antitermination factor NusG